MKKRRGTRQAIYDLEHYRAGCYVVCLGLVAILGTTFGVGTKVLPHVTPPGSTSP